MVFGLSSQFVDITNNVDGAVLVEARNRLLYISLQLLGLLYQTLDFGCLMKVSATDKALALIEAIKKQHGQNLLFHQSGGCCDGSAPMCYPANEYMIGQDDIQIGTIGGVPFYISESQHGGAIEAAATSA